MRHIFILYLQKLIAKRLGPAHLPLTQVLGLRYYWTAQYLQSLTRKLKIAVEVKSKKSAE